MVAIRTRLAVMDLVLTLVPAIMDTLVMDLTAQVHIYVHLEYLNSIFVLTLHQNHDKHFANLYAAGPLNKLLGRSSKFSLVFTG